MLKALKQARAAFSLLNPEAVRTQANRPITFGLVAEGSEQFAEMEAFLIPDEASDEERDRLFDQVFRAGNPGVPDQVDLVLYQHGVEGPKGTYTFQRQDPALTVAEIVGQNDDIALALARQYPIFRRTVVEQTIHSVARENAFFAIATALPDVIPNLLELPWAFGEFASDTVFMTVNQVRMAFLIAAACGREIGFQEQKVEIVGIGAGAVGWRALARELAGKIPFGGGLIPKGAIAYAVTYAIGKGLEKYYYTGEPYTKAEHDLNYRQGYQRGHAVSEAIAGTEAPDPDAHPA
jgi:uncharacterized protein (DUF697 family)